MVQTRTFVVDHFHEKIEKGPVVFLGIYSRSVLPVYFSRMLFILPATGIAGGTLFQPVRLFFKGSIPLRRRKSSIKKNGFKGRNPRIKSLYEPILDEGIRPFFGMRPQPEGLGNALSYGYAAGGFRHEGQVYFGRQQPAGETGGDFFSA